MVRAQQQNSARIRTRLLQLAQFASCIVLALGVRLVVWRWREFYPLGGDEQEYFKQALTLLQQRQYLELNLMRPPLYTVFLAGSVVLFDSAIQNLRLVQALISTLTVVPLAALAWELFRSRRVALIAALLFALNYTLAATATELLTETVFLFGLCVALWLIIAAPQRRRAWLFGILAGLTLGALALVRSVALPLVGLATLWLFCNFIVSNKMRGGIRSTLVQPFFLLPCAFCLVVLPWTARNYATYGAVILIDTTGAENLWLDNNPSAATPDDLLGRETAKRELYALGDDRAARQTLATQRGFAEIRRHPAWFFEKAWREAKTFFALQYFDELREKRAIWVAPAEVWAKVVLGDGLWLVLIGVGSLGCLLYAGRLTAQQSWRAVLHPVWMLVLWALYLFATALIFHVELRYRLPIYPILAPFAAFALVRGADWLQPCLAIRPFSFAHVRRSDLRVWVVSIAVALALTAATLLHRNYLAESWMLVHKHAALARAEQALVRSDAAAAQRAANEALGWDATSALAQVALARAALFAGDATAAHAALDHAIAALAAHPQAHLVRGALLRATGDQQAARSELGFETGSLQDLQAWAWAAFAPISQPPPILAIGDGLDLGFVQGFYPAEQGSRWTRSQAQIQINALPQTTSIELELNPGRPITATLPVVVITCDSVVERIQLREGWHVYRVPVMAGPRTLAISIQTATFRPRNFEPTSSDNRELGVMVRRVTAK